MRTIDSPSIDFSPIFTPQIFNEPFIIFKKNPCVVGRDMDVLKLDIYIRSSPQIDFLLSQLYLQLPFLFINFKH